MATKWRWCELGLLLLAAAPVASGVAVFALMVGRRLSDERFWPIYAFLAAAFASHAALSVGRFRGDQVLVPLVTVLAGTGMLLVDRLVPALVWRQLVWSLLGCGVMLLVALGPWEVRLLERYKYTSAAAGMVLVALTLLFGIDPNGSGARLWLGTSRLAFQPSEIMKVLLVIFLAGYLADKRELLTTTRMRWGPIRLPPVPYLAPLLAMWGISLALLVSQKDLGAAILFFGVFLVMFYIAVGQFRYVVAGTVLFLAGAALAYLLFAHVRLRVEIWIDPWVDPQGRSYQMAQALYSLAAGGVFGTGFGNGYPLYVPAAHTDFPFIALAEEAGLVISLGLLLVYAVLVTRGLEVAIAARLPFNRLLASGLSSVLALQTMVIVGGNLKLIPLTGVTLPFVSYGGSSLLANFVILGVLLRTSHEEAVRRALLGTQAPAASPRLEGRPEPTRRRRQPALLAHSARHTADM